MSFKGYNGKKSFLRFFKISILVLLAFIFLSSAILVGYEGKIRVDEHLSLRNMGEFESRDAWIQAMKNKAIEQYEHMPIIVSNPNFPALLHRMRADRNEPFYTWQTAGLLLGLKEALSKDELMKIASKRNDLTDLVGKEIDSAILGYAISYTNLKEENEINNLILENINSAVDSNTNTLMYRKHVPSIRFSDTVGLVSPFLALTGEKNGDSELVNMAVDQIREFEKTAFLDELDYLPFHGFDMKSGTPLGIYGWGRGTGWYAIGLIDTLAEVGVENFPDLEESVVRLADTLIKYQQNDGGWGSTINDSNGHTDTSATALNLYFIKRASNLGILDQKNYIENIQLAEKYLMENTRSDGVVMNSEGEAIALGNYSKNYIAMPFTQGMVLRAVSIEI